MIVTDCDSLDRIQSTFKFIDPALCVAEECEESGKGAVFLMF
jgi:hypothetical protein